MRGFGVFALVLALCVGTAAAVGTFLWRRFREPVGQELEHLRQDASRFAAEHEQSECSPEAFRRLAACDGFWCRVQTPIFAKGCLQRARPSPGLCADVPDSLVEGALWPAKRCLEIDAEPELCQRILREVWSVCMARAHAPGASSSGP